MRLFLAIDLDDGAADAARSWTERLRRDLGSAYARDVAFANPAQLHLTLHFLGEVDAPRADALIGALAAPLDLPAFEAAFAAVGTFPASGAPRVLWIGLGDGREQAVALHAGLRPRLRQAGVEPPADERPFFPHVTLARLRRTADSGADRALRTAAGALPTPRARWTVGRVTLYQSLLSPHGARHEVRARCALDSGSAISDR